MKRITYTPTWRVMSAGRALTPRILLTHTSGFANFRWLEEDRRLRFHHDPGSRYGYSGEGFYIPATRPGGGSRAGRGEGDADPRL